VGALVSGEHEAPKPLPRPLPFIPQPRPVRRPADLSLPLAVYLLGFAAALHFLRYWGA
jgi:hypothetical protein